MLEHLGARGGAIFAAALLLLGADAGAAAAQRSHDGKGRHRDREPLLIEKQGYFFVGGEYHDSISPVVMGGQMYVEYHIPARSKGRDRGVRKYPIVFVHGGLHSGVGWWGTPDGRPGWADYFLRRGWPVYVVDVPGRAASPYVDTLYGPRSFPTVRQAEDRWAAAELADPSVQWPQAHLHTRWPGGNTHGTPEFDMYFSHLSPAMPGALQEQLTTAALLALLEKIGPAVLLIHSQPGGATFAAGDTRPDLVKAIVAVEPGGPPFYSVAGVFNRPWGITTSAPLAFEPAVSDPSELTIEQEAEADGPGLARCWLQTEPARQLPGLAQVPILLPVSESGYNAEYDHCTSKFLRQAGVANSLLRLTDIGIYGNGHLMLIEDNNLEIARVIEDWVVRTLRSSDNSSAHAGR